MNQNRIIKKGSQFLKNKNIVSYLLDTEIILSDLLGINREKLILKDKFELSKKEILKFKELIKRRANYEPIAYIVKKKEFWKRNFFVNRETLIPRPETELLVEKIIKHFRGKSPYILDIGTGSGCILLSILEDINKARGVGIDLSKKALSVAKKNSISSDCFHRVKFLNKSVDDFINKKFDIVVSNPPYICKNDIKNLDNDIKYFEPKVALDGGNDGLDVIRKVIYKSKTILKTNGLLAIEIGNKQYKQVSQLLKIGSFREKDLIRDYQDNIRCIISTFIN